MGAISRELERFIADYVDSVGILEVLLLTRANADRKWSPTEVSRELRTDRAWAEIQLEYLRSRGLLTSQPGDEPRYRYAPADGRLDRVVAELGDAFAKRRVTVIRLIVG